MLVSHSHKFILIKSKKTAGSSIQSYLEPYCKDGIVETHFPGSHRTAESTKKKVGDEIWNSYLKICPMRNPWDKMVSWYFWRGRKRSVFVLIKRILQGKHPQNQAYRLSFKGYLKFLKTKGKLNIDLHNIYVDGEFPEYFYIRYEHLHDDMKALCDRLDIPYDPEKMPQKKVGYRDEKGYQQHYDEESRQLVAEAYSREIEKFNYTFD